MSTDRQPFPLKRKKPLPAHRRGFFIPVEMIIFTCMKDSKWQQPFEAKTLQDLTEWFRSPQQEHETLEFKSGDVHIREVAREVAGFLNTKGGWLIIGAPKEQQHGQKKICQGSLTSSHLQSSDWILAQLKQLITPAPAPDTIRIRKLTDNQVQIYLIQVAASASSPHMVNGEGRYYVRHKAATKPATHSEVEQLFWKTHKPYIKQYFKVGTRKGLPANREIFTLELENQSRFAAHDIEIELITLNTEEIVLHKEMKASFRQEDQQTIYGKIHQSLLGEATWHQHFTITNKFRPYLIYCKAWSHHTQLSNHVIVWDPANKVVLHDEKGKHFKSYKTDDLQVLLQYFIP